VPNTPPGDPYGRWDRNLTHRTHIWAHIHNRFSQSDRHKRAAANYSPTVLPLPREHSPDHLYVPHMHNGMYGWLRSFCACLSLTRVTGEVRSSAPADVLISRDISMKLWICLQGMCWSCGYASRLRSPIYTCLTDLRIGGCGMNQRVGHCRRRPPTGPTPGHSPRASSAHARLSAAHPRGSE